MTKPVIFAVTPDFIARDGLTETVQPWEDGMRAETGRGSFEWWYYDAHFDDGSTAVLVFMTKPLLERNGPLRPAVSLTITRPDGVKLAQLPIFPPGQFTAAKEGCDVRIGANWTKGDLHTYQVHIELDGLGADLVFTGVVPPWRPGAGKSFFGDLDHYFAWLPSIPFGTVSGTLVYDGQTHEVNGTGYHDHNWGNVGLNEVMDHWYWGRARVGDYTLIYVEQIGAKAYGYTRMPVFLLAKGDKIITGDGAHLVMDARDFVSHPDGRAYPREVDFHWKNGPDTVHLQLRKPKLIEGTSLLLSFPAWQQPLLRLFANPFYFRFNAELELTIDVNGLHDIQRGPTLFEIMILQGRKHP
jgi:predicted secreted hydrolase